MTRRQKIAVVVTVPVSVILAGLLWLAFTQYNKRKRNDHAAVPAHD